MSAVKLKCPTCLSLSVVVDSLNLSVARADKLKHVGH